MIFKVLSKETNIQYDVFAVNGNSFLIFANGEFTWRNMNLFYVDLVNYNGTLVPEQKSRIFKSSAKQKDII